jgi:peroxiredoxin
LQVDGRRVAAVLVALAGAGVVGVLFLRAVSDTARKTQGTACRALAPDPLPAALRNGAAPKFSLPDLKGRAFTLDKLRGKPVLLNFWATWCPPCIEEMPSMETLATRIGDRAVLAAVSVDESLDEVKRFFDKREVPLLVLHDPEKKVSQAYGSEKYPETFLIDAQGRVRYYFINKRDWAQVEATECLKSLR